MIIFYWLLKKFFINITSVLYKEGVIMLQILNWLCLISVSFLSFQVFSYMCKDAIKLYKSIIKTKKVYSKKIVIPTITDELLKKVAK